MPVVLHQAGQTMLLDHMEFPVVALHGCPPQCQGRSWRQSTAQNPTRQSDVPSCCAETHRNGPLRLRLLQTCPAQRLQRLGPHRLGRRASRKGTRAARHLRMQLPRPTGRSGRRAMSGGLQQQTELLAASGGRHTAPSTVRAALACSALHCMTSVGPSAAQAGGVLATSTRTWTSS